MDPTATGVLAVLEYDARFSIVTVQQTFGMHLFFSPAVVGNIEPSFEKDLHRCIEMALGYFQYREAIPREPCTPQ